MFCTSFLSQIQYSLIITFKACSFQFNPHVSQKSFNIIKQNMRLTHPPHTMLDRIADVRHDQTGQGRFINFCYGTIDSDHHFYSQFLVDPFALTLFLFETFSRQIWLDTFANFLIQIYNYAGGRSMQS